MEVRIVNIADQNNQASRELAEAIQEATDIDTPYDILHVDKVGDLKRCFRASPAVGVLLLASDLQGAVTIAEILKLSALMAAGDTISEIIATRCTNDEALTLPPTLYREWTGTGMGTIAAGEIVRYTDMLYRCPSGITAPFDHQPPGGDGMLAVYVPIRPGTVDEILLWEIGEEVSIGTKRIDPTDGKVYEVYTSAGVNVWEPHTAPSVWRLT